MQGERTDQASRWVKSRAMRAMRGAMELSRMCSLGEWAPAPVGPRPSRVGRPRAAVTVTLYSGSTVLANVTLNGSGQGSLTASTGGYPAGTYPVDAFYAGDGSYLTGSSNAVEVKITK